MAFHQGYQSVPIPGLMPSFGHVGLGGTIGWADPEAGLGYAFVHNRLLSPIVIADHVSFVGLDALIRRGQKQAMKRSWQPVGTAGFDKTAAATAASEPSD